MGDWIALGITLLIVVLAVVYLVRAKKSGKKCIGCPDGCCTASKKNDDSPCACCCGCGGGAEEPDKTKSE